MSADPSPMLLGMSLLLLVAILGMSCGVRMVLERSARLQPAERFGAEGDTTPHRVSQPSNIRGWKQVIRYYSDPLFMSRVQGADRVASLAHVSRNTDLLHLRPKAAFAMRRIVKEYLGPTFRVRRKNGTGEIDVYMDDMGTVSLVGGYDASRDLAGWANGQPIQVVAWYDQSGNAHHMKMRGHPDLVRDEDGLLCIQLDGTTQFGMCDGSVENSNEATAHSLGIQGDHPKTIVALARAKHAGDRITNAMGLFDLGDLRVGRRFSVQSMGGARNNRAWLANFSSGDNFAFDQDGPDSWLHYTLAYSGEKSVAAIEGRPLASATHKLDTDGPEPLRLGGLSTPSVTGMGSQTFRGRMAGLVVMDTNVPEGVKFR